MEKFYNDTVPECGLSSGYGYSDGCGHGKDSICGNDEGSVTVFIMDDCSFPYVSTASGCGEETGCGFARGRNIKSFNGMPVCNINFIPTIITGQVSESVAQGYVVQDDFTLKPCYVARKRGHYAHGSTIDEAFQKLETLDFYDNTFMVIENE